MNPNPLKSIFLVCILALATFPSQTSAGSAPSATELETQINSLKEACQNWQEAYEKGAKPIMACKKKGAKKVQPKELREKVHQPFDKKICTRVPQEATALAHAIKAKAASGNSNACEGSFADLKKYIDGNIAKAESAHSEMSKGITDAYNAQDWLMHNSRKEDFQLNDKADKENHLSCTRSYGDYPNRANDLNHYGSKAILAAMNVRDAVKDVKVKFMGFKKETEAAAKMCENTFHQAP